MSTTGMSSETQTSSSSETASSSGGQLTTSSQLQPQSVSHSDSVSQIQPGSLSQSATQVASQSQTQVQSVSISGISSSSLSGTTTHWQAQSGTETSARSRSPSDSPAPSPSPSASQLTTLWGTSSGRASQITLPSGSQMASITVSALRLSQTSTSSRAQISSAHAYNASLSASPSNSFSSSKSSSDSASHLSTSPLATRSLFTESSSSSFATVLVSASPSSFTASEKLGLHETESPSPTDSALVTAAPSAPQPSALSDSPSPTQSASQSVQLTPSPMSTNTTALINQADLASQIATYAATPAGIAMLASISTALLVAVGLAVFVVRVAGRSRRRQRRPVGKGDIETLPRESEINVAGGGCAAPTSQVAARGTSAWAKGRRSSSSSMGNPMVSVRLRGLSPMRLPPQLMNGTGRPEEPVSQQALSLPDIGSGLRLEAPGSSAWPMAPTTPQPLGSGGSFVASSGRRVSANARLEQPVIEPRDSVSRVAVDVSSRHGSASAAKVVPATQSRRRWSMPTLTQLHVALATLLTGHQSGVAHAGSRADAETASASRSSDGADGKGAEGADQHAGKTPTSDESRPPEAVVTDATSSPPVRLPPPPSAVASRRWERLRPFDLLTPHPRGIDAGALRAGALSAVEGSDHEGGVLHTPQDVISARDGPDSHHAARASWLTTAVGALSVPRRAAAATPVSSSWSGGLNFTPVVAGAPITAVTAELDATRMDGHLPAFRTRLGLVPLAPGNGTSLGGGRPAERPSRRAELLQWARPPSTQASHALPGSITAADATAGSLSRPEGDHDVQGVPSVFEGVPERASLVPVPVLHRSGTGSSRAPPLAGGAS